jgi:hypothetical protein
MQDWEKAGAEFGWIRPNNKFGTVVFVTRTEGQPGDLPAFQYVSHDARRPNPNKQWKDGVLANLPPPTQPFGLVLAGPHVIDDSLKELSAFKKLQVLGLKFTTRVSGTGLSHLKGLDNLRTIDLGGYRGVELSDDVLHALREIHLLHCCELAKTKGEGRPANAADVVWFTLPGGKVTEASIKELQEFSNIEQVTFFGRLTSAGINDLNQLSTLKKVILSPQEVKDSGLKELKAVKNLRGLQLRGTQLTDTGLKELSDFESLEELVLGPNQFTVAGLNELKKLKNLKRLIVALDVRITDASLDELRKALPECQITTGILPK